jgi:two-component system, chemotaxis family, chemotaxis protein CheY
MTRSLLVVDDAIIIRELIKDAAIDEGWTIAGEACDGQQAIDRYRELRPDAVTLDLVMPYYNGLHAIRGILKLAPDARILVVSALDQKNILKEAFALGVFDFIVKPFTKAILVETLNRMTPVAY